MAIVECLLVSMPEARFSPETGREVAFFTRFPKGWQARMKQDGKSQNKRRSLATKPVTECYLRNAGGYYLQRYASSEKNFRDVLMRKARRRSVEGVEESELAGWIEQTCEFYRQMGALDDAAYAENRVLSMRRSGRSAAWIRRSLKAKGVAGDLIEQKLVETDQQEHTNDWQAALAYARRRRFGPFGDKMNKHKSSSREQGYKERQKQLASFARSGFRFDLARRIVDAQTIDELELDG